MAPIDLKLGQNAFQVIPELSLFDVEDRKIFGFFGVNYFVLAGTHASWPGYMFPGPRHMCPGPRRMCLGQDTMSCVLAKTIPYTKKAFPENLSASIPYIL